MTSSYGYIPPELYAFLVQTAHDNGLSIKEVQTMFIRKVAHDLGFVCDHSKVGMAKTTGEPFCQGCWTRLATVKPPTYFKGKLVKAGEYWTIETLLDRFYKDEKAKEVSTREVEEEPVGMSVG
ncbi:MAG TPA: hypothetical protein VF220_10680 [Nitrososphaeraceae archaeon]